MMTKLLLLLALVLVPSAARAVDLPLHPPCGAPPGPAYAAPGTPPALAVWNEVRLIQIGWRAPHCLNWDNTRTRLVVALSGEFRFSGPIDRLLERAGRLSEYTSVRYWSVNDKAWRNLASGAGIVDGPAGRNILPDLTATDMIAGSSFFYFEVGRSGRAIYRLSVLEHTSRRFVLATANVTPMAMALVTLFEPGALQSVTFLERREPGTWGYYQVIRAGDGASAWALRSEASYVNRLVALYRHMAGLPTDSEPPAAR